MTTKIIPNTRQVYELTKKSYFSSKIGTFELLSAQQTLSKIELELPGRTRETCSVRNRNRATY